MTSAPPTANVGPNAEKSEPGAHANEFRHEGEEISKDQIAHREKAPEFPEAIEDQFGVSAVSDGPRRTVIS